MKLKPAKAKIFSILVDVGLPRRVRAYGNYEDGFVRGFITKLPKANRRKS